MIILGIETSCDETALALIEASGGIRRPKFKIIKNLVSSQIKTHAPYGGVVPMLAKREHAKNLPILFKKIQATTNKLQAADAIAVTVGPGLEPCLWEGINFARDLAEKYNKKIVAVNHMEGHIASVLLQTTIDKPQAKIDFPAIALLVSGGHTELVLIRRLADGLDYKIIGRTVDDAVGEAFDKVARMLGLPYPGGPELAKLANKAKKLQVIKLPRPMLNSPNFNFSFSGLKTAVLYALSDNPKLDKAIVAREFQNAAVEVLVSKTLKAVKKHKPKTLIVAGGVAANKHLQKEFTKKLQDTTDKLKLLLPEQKFTGDNAAMIATAGYFHALNKKFAKPKNLKADGNLSL